MFAAVTGYFNPMHTDEIYARSNRFGKRIAHGGVAAGLVTHILGMKLPGVGTFVSELRYKYLAPVYLGDTITCLGKFVEKDMEYSTATIHFVF